MERFLANLFFVTVLFPYLTFGFPAYSDSQPWSVIVGILLLTVSAIKRRKVRLEKGVWILIGLSLICILNTTVFYIFNNGDFVTYLRIVFKYVSFMVIIPVVTIYLEKFHPKILIISTLLWFIVVTMQVLTAKVLIEFILPRVSFPYGRNFALGFAPEPAYMAKVITFFLLFIDYYKLSGSIKPTVANTLTFISITMIIASASLTGLFLMMTYLIIKLFLHLKTLRYATLSKLTLIFITFIILILSFPIFVTLIKEYLTFLGRIGDFWNKITQQSLVVLYQDPSFRSRFYEFVGSFKILAEGHFFGLGVPEGPKGSIFAPIYDSGVFGLLFVITVLSLLCSSVLNVQGRFRYYLIELTVLFTLLTFSESLSASYIAFILGIGVNLQVKYRRSRQDSSFLTLLSKSTR